MEAVVKNKTGPQLHTSKKKMVIVTCCLDDWGGSEDLWWKAAIHLREQGLAIMVLKLKINPHHPKFRQLAEKGILLGELDRLSRKSRPERLFIKAWNKIKNTEQNLIKINFENYLKQFQPDHVLISQGINFDGLTYAESCMKLHIPFSIVSQKAVEFYWPSSYERAVMGKAFQQARHCFFVSRHNLQLTEEQFGFRFKNAQVIWNPVKIKREPIAYPSTEEGWKLACVGRLFIIDKGQDILLRILSQEKWRQRPLTVSFIGTGVDEEGLKAMAALLNISNVHFSGHVENMEEVWNNHHALVLPSRSEGLPLVVLEAMAAGRTTIAAKAGGVDEVIEDGKTGFLAEATASSFDEAMERAWQQRNHWQMMGRQAFQFAQEGIPQTPEIDFANIVTDIIYES
jgi:glycosyltransferase involved in cell wall biosynthesis